MTSKPLPLSPVPRSVSRRSPACRAPVRPDGRASGRPVSGPAASHSAASDSAAARVSPGACGGAGVGSAVGSGAGPVAGGLAGLLAGRPCDPRGFQRLYPDRWAAFLRAHFRSSVEIAVFFDVDEKTARVWSEGVTGPRGWAVSYALVAVPGAAPFLLDAA